MDGRLFVDGAGSSQSARRTRRSLPEEAFGTIGRVALRYCSLTIVLTLAVTPSAISTTTM